MSQSSSQIPSGLRSQTLIRLRWVAILGQTITVLFVHFGLHFPLPLTACLIVIALSAGGNVMLMAFNRTQQNMRQQNMFWQLVFDMLQLGVLLGLSGGLGNPFVILLAAPVVVAMAALHVRHAAILFAMVIVLSAFMIQFALPLPWYGTQMVSLHSRLFQVGMGSATLITIAFISIYVWYISAERNRMATALAATEAVLAKEHQLAALGGLAAATAHELGTPLGTIQLVANELDRNAGRGCTAQSGEDPCPFRDDISLILSQTKVCRQILSKLSTRGTKGDAFLTQISLLALIEETAAAQTPGNIALHTYAKSKDPIDTPAHPQLRRQPETIHALNACVENAISFAKTKVTINGRWDPDWISITICDDGPGFAPSILERLGEPYITSRLGGDAQGRGGLGLGVFIAKNLIERTGGEIVCGRSSSLNGAMVQIIWPRDQIEMQADTRQSV